MENSLLFLLFFLLAAILSNFPETITMLAALTDRLLQTYPPGHEITIYRASEYAAFEPHIGRVPLRDLPTADIDPMATLFIPPMG